jgi:hypothetical protein
MGLRPYLFLAVRRKGRGHLAVNKTKAQSTYYQLMTENLEQSILDSRIIRAAHQGSRGSRTRTRARWLSQERC